MITDCVYEWTTIGEYKAVILKVKKTEFESEITVLPEFGANLLRFCYNGNIIIDYSKEKLSKKDFTGMPIMFPTPNRVYEAKVKYNGENYLQIKNGKKWICHGLVYDEPFEVSEIVCNEEDTYIHLSLDINEESLFFDSFPFKCRLHIIYSINIDGLTVKYKIENNSQVNLQYGFGIHPYFRFKQGDKLVLPSHKFLELKDEFPTGRIIETQENFKNINAYGTDIQTLQIDDDFIRDENGLAYIFNDSNFKIEINASEQFRHFVVYKNKLDNFICIEPQTCSINAHNLAFSGFENANIINVAPGKADEGYVKISMVVQ